MLRCVGRHRAAEAPVEGVNRRGEARRCRSRASSGTAAPVEGVNRRGEAAAVPVEGVVGRGGAGQERRRARRRWSRASPGAIDLIISAANEIGRGSIAYSAERASAVDGRAPEHDGPGLEIKGGGLQVGAGGLQINSDEDVATMCRRKGRHTVGNTACGVETTWQCAKQGAACRQLGRWREWPIEVTGRVRLRKWWGDAWKWPWQGDMAFFWRQTRGFEGGRIGPAGRADAEVMALTSVWAQ